LIYFTHGAVDRWNGERISHGLMLSESVFTRHLQQRATKYVSLTDALAGKGDALTIDDATYAGLKAALLARKHGHAVSWFVNGMNVERRLPYFPFQLSWMLDQTRQTGCFFDRQNWDLTHKDHRRALRLRLKQNYMRMGSCEEIAEMVEAFSACVGVMCSTLDESLGTVTANELALAVDAGVELRNHGWAHLNPRTFSKRELTADVQRNDAYLASFGQPGARIFAPPFGRRVAVSFKVASCVLLADRSFASDRPHKSFVNRHELHLAEGMSVQQFNCLAQTA
jgi:hypothetical protein